MCVTRKRGTDIYFFLKNEKKKKEKANCFPNFPTQGLDHNIMWKLLNPVIEKASALKTNLTFTTKKIDYHQLQTIDIIFEFFIHLIHWFYIIVLLVWPKSTNRWIDRFISIIWLIDFYGMSNYLVSSHAKKLENCVQCTFMFIFLCNCFLECLMDWFCRHVNMSWVILC